MRALGIIFVLILFTVVGYYHYTHYLIYSDFTLSWLSRYDKLPAFGVINKLVGLFILLATYTLLNTAFIYLVYRSKSMLIELGVLYGMFVISCIAISTVLYVSGQLPSFLQLAKEFVLSPVPSFLVILYQRYALPYSNPK